MKDEIALKTIVEPSILGNMSTCMGALQFLLLIDVPNDNVDDHLPSCYPNVLDEAMMLHIMGYYEEFGFPPLTPVSPLITIEDYLHALFFTPK